ncbi:MAG: cation-transporting P-type ATPase [Actinomycetota bacterium]|nr:cation-transporting P-type ATPase [Actinomycetota bacterium]
MRQITSDGGGGTERVDVVGLASVEAEERHRRDGPNTLPEARRTPAWRKLAGQLVHFFALMLWFAGALAILGGLPELGVAIFVVVVVNAVFAFAQEHRAERAAEELRALLPRTATVVRDGHRSAIDATELVVGDLVLLEGGDRVSADLECAASHGLRLDTSLLTGESEPAEVERGDVLAAGTYVVEGEGTAVVAAIGANTRLAGIALLTAGAERPQTPLALELHRLLRTIAAIAVGCGAGFFALTLLLDTPPSDGFVFAIGITVALVPEGLLPTVTLSLAVGAQRMARQHALVRRLEAVETLGSTTFVCTDKTGTLTQNRMNVVEVWTPHGTARIAGVGYEPDAVVDLSGDPVGVVLRRLAVVARRCSSGRAVLSDGVWEARGDPMEAAIDALVRRVGADPDRDADEDPERTRFPFDPRRRRASVVTDVHVLVKGAPDSVLDVCGGPTDEARAAVDDLSARGLRVLAVAERRHVERRRPSHADASGPSGRAIGLPSPPATVLHAERDLVLLGLLALEDPPRPDAVEAVASCRRAGIRLAMITGDHPATAAAIAAEVGLRDPDAPVLVGSELPTDDQVLGAVVDRDGVVVARVTPEDKLRIARALRARGHVVAMTGDGVNDGPALREADIGIAMGASGTDVAREAADLVLLDDHFATIVAAVRQGRATFHNARRFLTYHLTDNVAELTPFAVWALSGSRIPLALGVLQILALDIGTDTLSAAALGAEPPAERVLDEPPAAGRLLDRTVATRAFAVLGPTEILFEMGAFAAGLVAAGWRPGDPAPTGPALAAASGAAFCAVVVGQSANAFACRSRTRPAWTVPLRSNPFLAAAIAIELAVAATCIVAPAIAGALDHAAPPAVTWPLILAAAPGVVAADALWKALRRRADRRGERSSRPGPP